MMHALFDQAPRGTFTTRNNRCPDQLIQIMDFGPLRIHNLALRARNARGSVC